MGSLDLFKTKWEIRTPTGQILAGLKSSSIGQGLREGWIELSDLARQPGEQWVTLSESPAKDNFAIKVFINPARAHAERGAIYGELVGGLVALTCYILYALHLAMWRSIVGAILLLLLFPIGSVYMAWRILEVIGRDHDLEDLLPYGETVNGLIVGGSGLLFCLFVEFLVDSVFPKFTGIDFDTFMGKFMGKAFWYRIFPIFVAGTFLGLGCGYGIGYMAGIILRHRYQRPSVRRPAPYWIEQHYAD